MQGCHCVKHIDAGRTPTGTRRRTVLQSSHSCDVSTSQCSRSGASLLAMSTLASCHVCLAAHHDGHALRDAALAVGPPLRRCRPLVPRRDVVPDARQDPRRAAICAKLHGRVRPHVLQQHRACLGVAMTKPPHVSAERACGEQHTLYSCQDAPRGIQAEEQDDIQAYDTGPGKMEYILRLWGYWSRTCRRVLECAPRQLIARQQWTVQKEQTAP